MLGISNRAGIQDHINQIIDLTQPYPLTPRLAYKIYRTYGSASVKRLTENPYALARDVSGIGEQTATKIAKTIETKLGTTFNPPPQTNPHVKKYHYGGPGNGKLPPGAINLIRQKLRQHPAEALPAETGLKNPNFWTVPDLKRGVKKWFNVSWVSDSTYRNLFKKCNLTYCRARRAYVPTENAA